MYRDQRVCEADRDIFFSILWTGGVYKNRNLWTEGVLKMIIRWTHGAQSLTHWSLWVLNSHTLEQEGTNNLKHVAIYGSVLARHESIRLFDALFQNLDAFRRLFYSQMKELFKSFQPEVKASKLVKRFQSYGHLKFCIEIWAQQVSRRLSGTKVLQKYPVGIDCIK